jgi:hypothetical protein
MARTPEEIRAAAVAALIGPGGERLVVAARLAELDETLRPLVRDAAAAAVPQARIGELTGLARNTIRAWVRDSAS